MFDTRRNGIEVTRQALYDQVWSTPMTRLAKEYGISDVALAKICKKLNVPYPRRGYWRRKETGKTVKQLPLPPNTDPAKQGVTIHRTIRPQSVAPLSEDATQRIIAEQAPEQKIVVPDRLTNPHQLLKEHLAEWRSPKVDAYGAIWSGNIKQRNIRVSPTSLGRALRIMDTLFKALESRGYPVGIQQGYHKTLGVRINGEPITFGLEERFQRINHPDQKDLTQQWWQRQRYQYTPTGTLSLKITEVWADGLQKNWSDGKTAKIEGYLNEFIVGLLRAAEAVKAARLKRELEHQAQREAQQKREEEARKRQEESARRQALEQEAVNWAKAQQLRGYLAALKEMLIAKHGEIQPGSPAEHWLSWAHQHADRLDPLIREPSQ
ncbi:conserved hypothetical protein [Candidatus Nitrospira nitrosa]|uniref:Uncharacterized protein n=1 Tax=Candidatus Nitrospira nitrosa TaxID=1742972 RepID=A0A0S4L662_9BACT|nr:cell envelope integrity protein TolA [Candidatus Nitrospira nitrosa]CUS32141.1 conserved hypothetical protein [Candidatus Nitrospira nitrosa]